MKRTCRKYKDSCLHACMIDQIFIFHFLQEMAMLTFACVAESIGRQTGVLL